MNEHQETHTHQEEPQTAGPQEPQPQEPAPAEEPGTESTGGDAEPQPETDQG
jgi:hypothetical protein